MDNKITISRSFSRTFQIKDYEPASFFSSRNMEIPVETSMKEQQEISEELFSLCMSDVLKAKQDYTALSKTFNEGVAPKKLRELEDLYATGSPVPIEDFENCTLEQQVHLNHFKKYYKRTPAFKATIKSRKEKE